MIYMWTLYEHSMNIMLTFLLCFYMNLPNGTETFTSRSIFCSAHHFSPICHFWPFSHFQPLMSLRSNGLGIQCQAFLSPPLHHFHLTFFHGTLPPATPPPTSTTRTPFLVLAFHAWRNSVRRHGLHAAD